MATLRFATLNIRGFRDRNKQTAVVTFARSKGIDLLFLQETNFRSPLDVTLFRRNCQVDGFFSLTSARSCGVGVVFVTDRFRRKSHCVFGANGRTLVLDVFVDGSKVRFVNVYAPVTRSDTNPYFKELHGYLLEPAPHVVLGDFNCVVDSTRDVRGPGQGGSTYHAKELVKILRNLRLTDEWVHVHGNEFVPTRTSRTTASRLDRAYVPERLVNSIMACEVLALPEGLSERTDHLPLVTTVRGTPGRHLSNEAW
ncbi:uncharacterized protein LOC142765923 [Rhipicephalus microplus]|uniref:uncharacterized protein LOC142765923 n=1 Tax=Rhipicephalus microplus TaxID=6941 RepID=UPI003F6AB178